jgi:hypothetical protein
LVQEKNSPGLLGIYDVLKRILNERTVSVGRGIVK